MKHRQTALEFGWGGHDCHYYLKSVKLQASLMMDPCTSAQDVMQCDLCETSMVQMHCDTCLINLCKACVGEHISTDECEDHKVVKFQSRKSTPLYPGCTFHDKERCEMYCNQCHIPVCNTCIASNQHVSHTYSKILQVMDKRKAQIIKEKNELSETIFPTYQDISFHLQNRMSQLEKKYGDLSTAITKHGEDWHREIDKLVQKLNSEVEEMKTTQLHTLQKHLDEVNKKMSDINDEINSIDAALDSNNISTVLSVMPDVDEYKKIPQKIVPLLPKFTPGRIQEELCKLFGTLSSISVRSEEHGYSIKTTQKSPEAASSPVIKQLLDEPQTVNTIHTGYRSLYNVACLSDEEIWTGGNSSTMKLFSINQGSQLKSITTKSQNAPWNIAVTNSGDLVYTDYRDRTVNIVKNEDIQTMITLQGWIPHGVCSTSSDDLLVIMESDDVTQSKVVRYSGSTETQTIQSDDQGQPLYSSGGYYQHMYITENRNLDICVADYEAKAVVVVNLAGKLRFRYTGHTPTPKNLSFSPRGITTDSQSHILTVDYNNDCVHIIDQDGQFLRYIDSGLSEPWGLCIDTNDNLFVAQYRNKQVKKIQYLQ